jgi:FkbM family methyltransferase
VQATLRVPGSRRRLRLAGGPDERDFLAQLERRRGRYERRLGMLLARLVRPDDHICDVGAHIGAVSLALAALAPAGRVDAFEPSPTSAALLAGNARANGLGNVHVHQLAMLDTPGPAHLRRTPFSAGSFVAAAEDGLAEPVAATSLDAWAAETGLERLDLLKLDVEGAELRVLAGAAATLARHRPTIVVECNPPALRRVGGAGPEQLVAALADRYPRVWWIGAAGSLVPLRSPREVIGHLRARGVGDLVASARRPGRPSPLAPAGAVKEAWERRLARGLVGRPPRLQFAIASGLRLRLLAPAPASAPAAGVLELPVEVRNGGDGWVSSRFHTHPVRLSSRWLDAAGRLVGENPRSDLPRPLGPGERAEATLTALVPGEPGAYRLLLGAVQEGFAWVDELDPDSGVTLALEVLPTPAPARHGGL